MIIYLLFCLKEYWFSGIIIFVYFIVKDINKYLGINLSFVRKKCLKF